MLNGLSPLAISTRRPPARPAGPGADLITNGVPVDSTSWTRGGTTISANAIHFTGISQGGIQYVIQVLAGGSVVAPTFRVTLDLTVISSGGGVGVTATLLGAANEVRGTASFGTTGAAQTADIAASGEVSQFKLSTSSTTGDDADVSNVKLQPIS